METKANFVLIGAFALAGIIGSLGFLLWLAKVEVERQYAYYDVLFDDVSGLGNAGDVRFNGLVVGSVVGLALDPDDPSKVRVRLEVAQETPVRADTVASLQSQGVTGVSFVSLSGGSQTSEMLPEGEVIRSEPSAFQSVLEGAPELLQKAVVLLEDINTLVNDQNRAAVDTILENLASATGRLDRSLAGFETLSGDLSLAARDVSGFAGRLEALSQTADTTLTTATATLETAREAIGAARGTIDRATGTLDTLDQTLASAKTLMEGDLVDVLQQGSATAKSLQEGFARLEPAATQTFEAATRTLGAAEQSFASVNTLLEGDLGGIITEVRSAVTVFTDTLTKASANIDTISTEVLAASKAAAGFAKTLEAVVGDNRDRVSAFFRLGLPEFLQLTEEARQLVGNLDRFIDRVERDPTRFLLGTQGSEFRR
jgi:phospholipid/cholesterol/gamma-HCH transport system substrate-binding protein